MPITFKSRHSPDVMMLEAVGLEMLRLMGHSGSVPGSLTAEDLPAALAHLEAGVAAAPARDLSAHPGPTDAPGDDGDDEDRDESAVGAAVRAGPLIDMLKRAIEEDDYVIWDR